MSYWRKALQHLEQTGKITCQDIINITHTNCPHSVIRDLKKQGISLREEVKKVNGKTFKVFFLVDFKPKEEKPKVTMPERIGQITLNLGELKPIEEDYFIRRARFGVY